MHRASYAYPEPEEVPAAQSCGYAPQSVVALEPSSCLKPVFTKRQLHVVMCYQYLAGSQLEKRGCLRDGGPGKVHLRQGLEYDQLSFPGEGRVELHAEACTGVEV